MHYAVWGDVSKSYLVAFIQSALAVIWGCSCLESLLPRCRTTMIECLCDRDDRNILDFRSPDIAPDANYMSDVTLNTRYY